MIFKKIHKAALDGRCFEH